ncbi:hypothetical protein C5471_15985 [Photorhabdus tasmaniensis]|uniref:Uncharacterized protein n=1 Tax=Photorhabdus tasmaniensis TaxID=1004159 RepID=A0ABX0GLN7_9GAMM|nr:hypothetical protein [Photorhabdus tasmaniensis]
MKKRIKRLIWQDLSPEKEGDYPGKKQGVFFMAGSNFIYPAIFNSFISDSILRLFYIYLTYHNYLKA